MKRGVEKRDAGGDRTYARRGSRLAPETEMAESGSFAANVREREVRKQGENRTDDTLVPPHEYGGRFGSPQLQTDLFASGEVWRRSEKRGGGGRASG